MKRNRTGLCALLIAAAITMTGQRANCAEPSSDAAPAPIPPISSPCPRQTAGGVVENPPALFSHNGALRVNFSYQTATDADGRTLFCFMTSDGLENPTLYVRPGDHLIINVTNNTPPAPVEMAIDPPNCGASEMTGSSVNIHYHGTNTSPTCQQDDVIHAVINSGQSFTYKVDFPTNEPPGLYWYHPHIHGQVEAALQGGGSGVIVVEGLQDLQPAVAGMRQRLLVVRDEELAGEPTSSDDVPAWDLTLNNIPISYPDEVPAVIQMKPGKRQLWRVANISADSILDLQVQYDGVPQDLQIVALDGVPIGSQDGGRHGKLVTANHLLIPTAGRAEFIVPPPSAVVRDARLLTLAVNTGPDGDNDPQRTLAIIQPPSAQAAAIPTSDSAMSATIRPTWRQRFEQLMAARVTARRTLYFSENNPLSQFFITVDGATPTLFNPNNPPAIVTTQGSVEDWRIENRSLENHEFHIHQVHFRVLSQNNFEINGSQPDARLQGQFLDTINVPFWDGNPAHPYPSVTLRMDFRGPDIGDFVYHCHIAEHEDNGMMAIIRVKPAAR